MGGAGRFWVKYDSYYQIPNKLMIFKKGKYNKKETIQ